MPASLATISAPRALAGGKHKGQDDEHRSQDENRDNLVARGRIKEHQQG